MSSMNRLRLCAILPLLCLLRFGSGSGNAFVGWEGATYNPKRTWGHDPKDESEQFPQGERENHHMSGKEKLENKPRWVEQLSWKPRSYIFHNFLSEKECEYLKDAARPVLTRSEVVGRDGNIVDPVRTSFGVFLPRCADSVLKRVEEKVANWTHLPLDHQEDIQILRYGYKQHYGAHTDSLMEDSPRLATVLIYLSDVEEGGETSFVKSWNWLKPEQAKIHGPFSECAQGHVSAKPKKGDALLFYSLKPNGELDDMSEHTGCPVLKGTKWTATFWIHNAPYQPEYFEDPPTPLAQDPGKCIDVNPSCKFWKEHGHCEEIAKFMHLHCPASCELCQKCAENDHACYAENRKRVGLPKIEDVMD